MTPDTRARRLWLPLLLLLALPGSAEAAGLTTVALDLRGLNEAIWWRIDGVTLESRAVTRLLQEGFSVVPPDAPADVRIRAQVQKEVLILESIQSPVAGRRTVQLRGPSSELHLEVAQKIVDLARASSRAAVVVPVEPIVAKPVEPPPAAAPVENAARWGVGVVASTLLRPGGVDGLALLEVTQRSGGTLLAATAGGGSMNGRDIQVFEAQLQLGAGLVFPVGARWELGAGLNVGALLHRFAVTGASVQPDGVRVDFLATVPLVLQLRVVGPLTVGLRVAPGFSSRGRQHLDGEVELWQRGAFRLEGGLMVSLSR